MLSISYCCWTLLASCLPRYTILIKCKAAFCGGFLTSSGFEASIPAANISSSDRDSTVMQQLGEHGVVS